MIDHCKSNVDNTLIQLPRPIILCEFDVQSFKYILRIGLYKPALMHIKSNKNCYLYSALIHSCRMF